jgi:hypothetical protein
MPVNYPKFDQKIQDQINLSNLQQPRTRPGVVMSFNKMSNTAVVVLDDHNSELMGSVLNDVPCPVTKGVQSVSPTIGTRCLVAFRDTNESSPYILNFFDDTKRNISFPLNYVVDTGIPRFMVH